MTLFRDIFGRSPEGVWYAPGRVNLIGEHTDYSDGFALPLAVDRGCRAYAASRDDGIINAWSVQTGEGQSLRPSEAGRATGWSGYVLGVAWALERAGDPIRGADVLIDSDVPAGAGLSSSAALTCSVGLALLELAGRPIDRIALAQAAQRAEREIVGAPVGIMDQLAALFGQEGCALLIDCRSLHTQPVPLGLASLDLRLVVIDTTVTHANAGGGYAARRRATEQAAALLGVSALRDATLEQLDPELLGEERTRRARHVITENARVVQAVAALKAGDVAALGALMAASHASLRDDFEVSVPEIETAVQAALDAGALGARLTGGGFGGSAIALVSGDKVASLTESVRHAAATEGFPQPHVFEVAASAGARRLE